MITEESIQQFSKNCENIFTQIRRDVIGQQEVVEGTVIAMIAGGNVLLEGVPGVGKTRLVRTLGRVFDMPFSRTKALFSAVPIPDPDIKLNRVILQGDIPSPANPPKGCKFHTRCRECREICREVAPEFRDLGGGHCVACHLYDDAPSEKTESAEPEAK